MKIPGHTREDGMLRIKSVFFALGVIATAACQSVSVNAQTTAKAYWVGTCKPGKADFNTIEDAVIGVPSGSTIKVCPGTYPEQVTIRQPLTLQGVSSGNDASVMITAPTTAVTNLPSPLGQPISAQLGVLGTGPVTISGLTLDGTGFAIPGTEFLIAGVASIDSTVALDHVVSQNLQGTNGLDFGVLVATENGTAQTFSMTNSLVGGAPNTGVFLVGPDLSFDIENNFVMLTNPLSSLGFEAQVAGGTLSGNTFNLSNAGSRAIVVLNGSTPVTINGNSINNAREGIEIDEANAATTLTKNSISASGTGIFTDSQPMTIQGNQILTTASGTGINLNCQQSVPAMSNNLFLGVNTGVANIPSGVALPKSPGTFIDTPNIETLCQ
jgi:hypothetical protein